MCARIYFDESIFESGFALRDYSTVRVNNAADRFLAERLGKEVVQDPCERPDHEDSSGEEDDCGDALGSNNDAVINLNPRFPCRGVNIYTLNIINKDVVSTLPFHKIKVESEDDRFRPIQIGESRGGVDRYTIGKLPAIDSALMLKYFAIKRPVTISVELYLLANALFVDYRKWFAFAEKLGIVETPNHTLLIEGRAIEEIECPRFYGEPIDLL